MKDEKGKRIFVPAPIWIVKAGLGIGIRIAKKHVPEEQAYNLENIDIMQLKKALDVLKAYKGLRMVDIKAKDGTEVKITI